MTRTIGSGKPVGIRQPPSGAGPQPCSRATRLARPCGQKLLLANHETPSDGDAADDGERDLGPHRPEREPVPAPLAPAVDEQGDDRETADEGEPPGQDFADRALGPSADEQEGRIEPVHGRAL